MSSPLKDRLRFRPTHTALEIWIASGAAWAGADDFLDAAQRNEAREFIARRRRDGIDYLAKRLLEGEARAIEDAPNERRRGA